MPAYYSRSLSDFLSDSCSTIIGARPHPKSRSSQAVAFEQSSRYDSVRVNCKCVCGKTQSRWIKFHRGFDWEHWFLDSADCELDHCDHKYCNDVRASSKLEVVATQFEIQGLELDWVGVCWGEDLLWNRKE